MRIGCMQSTLWPILMTMLIWNDLMKSQHDNLSLGSLGLMTSDRQILYPHQQPQQQHHQRHAKATAKNKRSEEREGRQPQGRQQQPQLG